MTRLEAYKIVIENGGHPYSRNAMADMLLKGAEIGRKEIIEKACDALCFICGKGCPKDWRDTCNIFPRFRKAMEQDTETE